MLFQGHQINVRDYSGWIPLHEAANHGYVEIVEYLLDKGATINDRGGDDCDGITPLHDAAANGKVDVVRLLVTRGANVHAKDDNVSLNGILIENSGYELLQSEMPNFPQLATKFDTKSPSEKIADQSAETG